MQDGTKSRTEKNAYGRNEYAAKIAGISRLQKIRNDEIQQLIGNFSATQSYSAKTSVVWTYGQTKFHAMHYMQRQWRLLVGTHCRHMGWHQEMMIMIITRGPILVLTEHSNTLKCSMQTEND